MNQEEADQDVVDEVSEEVDSRGRLIFKEERVGGRARVTTDEGALRFVLTDSSREIVGPTRKPQTRLTLRSADTR